MFLLVSVTRPEGVEVGVAVISTGRSLQEDFSKHGEVDRDDLLRVVVTLSESCSDLLLVHQTWQGGLEHKSNTNFQSSGCRTELVLNVLNTSTDMSNLCVISLSARRGRHVPHCSSNVRIHPSWFGTNVVTTTRRWPV